MTSMTPSLPKSSSPVASTERLAAEIRPAVDELERINAHYDLTLQNALAATESLLRLRHTFIDNDRPRSAKDAFRHLRGFEVLLKFVQKLAELYDPKTQPRDERKALLGLCKDALGALAEALQDHSGNRRYFARRIAGKSGQGGSALLNDALGLLSTKLGEAGNDAEHLYGAILAAALLEETTASLFTSLSATFGKGADSLSLSDLRMTVQRCLGDTETVEVPELLVLLLQLWLAQAPSASTRTILRLAVPACLCQLASQSLRNVVALHATGMLSSILPLISSDDCSENERILYKELGQMLLTQGLNSLEDAVDLYRNAHDRVGTLQFLLSALSSSREPPSIQFDLSRHGFSSVEFPALGRPFPPSAPSSSGYTLAVWARFDQFDTSTHTTIFGAFDPSQTCFLLAYLEKDTRYLILQTSIKGSRPSVRFKALAFEPNRWYHICVVHKRPRSISSPRASLFVDGEFVEQLKIDYPATPAASAAAPNKPARVQAFFGTPQDLATKLGRGVSSLRWSLASAVLLEEALSDDLISIFFNLRPRYHGNFQDCLGSFQTYKASAALNLRNENLHPGKEETSDIITAIRRKASVLIRESSILVNLSATAVLHDYDRTNMAESRLLKSISKPAAKSLQQLIRSSGNAIVLNGATPAVNEALTQAHGVGFLTGSPVVSVPKPLDDASWRIGGCTAVHLSLVQIASTAESLALAVEAFYDAIRDSWRNSEAMEREDGYGILAALLREKLGFSVGNFTVPVGTPIVCSNGAERSALAYDLLRLTLVFVGYDFENPNGSIITNPLAYRVLLVDLDIWRHGEPRLAQLYYGQFSTFASVSQYRGFNAKRLARMRVNRRLLGSLKEGDFDQTTLELYVTAFQALMESCMSADLLRSLSLFITYAVHKKPVSSLRKKASVRFFKNTQLSHGSENGSGKFLSIPELGVVMLRMFCDALCRVDNLSPIRRFGRAVTNKWLLYLMSEDDPEVVVLATKILARLIVTHGTAYTKKFADKNGGFVIMQHRLKRWWNVPALWPICFATFFGQDVARLNSDRPFHQSELLQMFDPAAKISVAFPEILPVIMEMMQSGLKQAVSASAASRSTPESTFRMSCTDPVGKLPQDAAGTVSILFSVVDFLAALQTKSSSFRDFASHSLYIQRLLPVLFPVVTGSDMVSADMELSSRDSGLSLVRNNLDIRPRSSAGTLVRTTTVERSGSRDETGGPLRRNSSFVLVTSDKAKHELSSIRVRHVFNVDHKPPVSTADSELVSAIMGLVLDAFVDQLLERKDFSGLGLYVKTPPGLRENQTTFETWVFRKLLTKLGKVLGSNMHVLHETRSLTNLGRFAAHLGEAVYEGWFTGGASDVMDFLGTVMEYLQQPEVSSLKSIRLCSQAVATIRSTLLRVVILQLSQVDDADSVAFLKRLEYWQVVLLAAEEAHPEYMNLMCYWLYAKLISDDENVRLSAASLWRVILVQKPTQMSDLLNNATATLQRRLAGGFELLASMEDTAFLVWVDDQREDLDALFFGTLSKPWESFVSEENNSTQDSARGRFSKRRDKLKQWSLAEKMAEETMRKHEVTFDHWVSNISASEVLKHQRASQDLLDDTMFMWSALSRLLANLRWFGGLLAETKEKKWRLDQTEGRSRMRLRVVPDDSGERQDYQPKRKPSEPPTMKIDTQTRPAPDDEILAYTPTLTAEPADTGTPDVDSDGRSTLDESFEVIDDPKPDLEDYEDKNRKVMRSLHRGDQVQVVCNISRVIGLEASEGLLILGKDQIYILDNFFQRADGEIVNVWQAPAEERDPYVRMITGRESKARKSQEHETRSWKWSDLVSVSKRRFLFRDVALEVFFTDGTSYLLTLISSRARDDLYSQLAAKAPQVTGSASHSRPEDAWRFETLRSKDDAPQSLGSKFASVFGQWPVHPATRRWIKGEISNFHYLMLVNTFAGRTFNDLTQYPVFPWVIADYTSEELDLTNPKTFRDLSKPMGCQTLEREAEFRERYKTFAEMGDENSPPFHYGTHYSSAMIVCSYLIRLQPFVKSYLLLQGGTFDHADRLFYSVRKAWESASRGNMTDVRELTPEFFYLPEFLVNSNKYDFGLLQSMQTAIDSVELPPWARGDPKIFIAKHREALESPYVTQNLHRWIDLVFGCKQKGEAAIEAVNVFHHLSYQGATDVDNIDDPVERLATIGIIHNFGQTPFQIFNRPHPQREGQHYRVPRLDYLAESLTQVPLSLLDIEDRVSSLVMKQDRLLCTAALRLNVPPTYDKYMEWGYFDGGVKFYSAESRKLLGHFEHLHIGQMSCAIFADSRTLITAGMDCTISIWTVSTTGKSVDLQPAGSLFGHRSPVTVLAVSRSFSTLLSASSDGQIMLWDLNQQSFVRDLPAIEGIECARINDVTGDIVICHGSQLSLYTLNGALLLEQAVGETAADDHILCCTFYEGVNNEWLERELILTGHKRGLANIWSKRIRNGRFELDLVRQLHHVDSSRVNARDNIVAGISCILASPTVVYTGDEAGRVYEWNCIQRP